MLDKQIEETPKYQDEIQRIMDECLPKTVIDDDYYQMTIAKISSVIIQSNSQLLDSLEKEVEAEDERLRDTLLKIDANVPGYQKYEREGINSMLVQNKWFNDLINNLKKGL